MAYELSDRLVVGIASSALFNLKKSDTVFKHEGLEAYRRHQRQRRDKPLKPGVAFPFIRRLLSLNDLGDAHNPLVEVIVLSRNSPDTGIRVMRSIAHHKLPISRAIFKQGISPYDYMTALNMSLFLSADKNDVNNAVAAGLPAGHVLKSAFRDDDGDELRIAFDFDGVLADDDSEKVYGSAGLPAFQEYETANAVTPHHPGPLLNFMLNINKIRSVEEARRMTDLNYELRLRVAIVTARNAPAHERALNSLNEWGITAVDDAFFLGGIEKRKVLDVLKPHIFFDDQRQHLVDSVPCVHIPFGVSNE
ncbi:5'-nucleotidase [Lentzea cavernae]|uniref:5'-nucleotidase n=1 Tax=Lentzea cavernae TaxID=2020703 RepID=A0ABQ3M9D8_9PSEU|nr:5'-nucleotidase [Lentzea cavernae]GHH34531.1 5'-nucleotidase [Lentzea cavernae]